MLRPPNNKFRINKQLDPELIKQQTLLRNYRVTNWAQTFSYYEYNTESLQSVFVDQMQVFQDCKQMIEDFNTEVREGQKNKTEIKNGPWKLKFYKELYDCLKEVLFTKDRLLQKSFCEKVNDWAFEQLANLATKGASAQLTLFKIDKLKEKYQSPKQDKKRPQSSTSSQNLTLKSNFQQTFEAPFSQTTKSKMNHQSVTDFKDLNKQSFGRPTTAKVGAKKSIMMRPTTATTRPDSAFTNQLSATRPESGFTDAKFRPESGINKFQERPTSGISFKEDVEFLYDDNQEIQNLQSQLEQIDETLEQQIYPQYPPDQVLKNMSPHEFIEEILIDYNNGQRTKNPEYDPPYNKIKEYKTKSIQFEEPAQVVNDFFQNLKDDPNEQISKPVNYLPIKEQPKQLETTEMEDGQEQLQQGDQLGGIIPSIPPQVIENLEGDANIIYVEKEIEDEDETKRGKMVPDIRNFRDDKVSSETFNYDLKKKFEQRSTYIHYQPSDDVEEIYMEQKYMKNRQKEVEEKRQDEERLYMIEEFSRAKSRLQNEINRKIDSQAHGSYFDELEYKPKQYTQKELIKIHKKVGTIGNVEDSPRNLLIEKNDEILLDQKQQEGEEIEELEDHDVEIEEDNEEYEEDMYDIIPAPTKNMKRPQSYIVPKQTTFKDLSQDGKMIVAKNHQLPKPKPYIGLEREMDEQKLKTTRKQYADLIGIPRKKEDEEHKPVLLPSLTVYSQGIAKPPRPFSAVFGKMDRETYRNEQLDEIEEIKKRMAKHQMTLNTGALQKALLIPEDINEETKLMDLPIAGQGLLVNPHFKSKKKKKKKKKMKKD